MNMRTDDELYNLIAEGMEAYQIADDDLLVVKIPPGTDTKTAEICGNAIRTSLSAIGKDNQLILIPSNVDINVIPEKEMNTVGWYRREPKPEQKVLDKDGEPA